MHCLAMDDLLLRIRCCDVFTGLLPNNRRPSIVGCALVGTFLPIRLLETAQFVTIYFANRIIASQARTASLLLW
jgi:hypothetical protein